MAWRRVGIWLGMLLVVAVVGAHLARATDEEGRGAERLAVVWTSDDPQLAHRMVLMYVHASERSGWFDENLVIVWGPSAELLATDEGIQGKVQAMMGDGVRFEACVVCADMYGVSSKLRELGVEVKPMGRPLTGLLQYDGWDVLSF